MVITDDDVEEYLLIAKDVEKHVFLWVVGLITGFKKFFGACITFLQWTCVTFLLQEESYIKVKNFTTHC